MIVVAAVFLAAAVFGCAGEMYYERDFPRVMWGRVILGVFLLLAAASVFGQQGVRFDGNVTTAASNVPSGAQAPVYTVPFAQISVFSDAACTVPVAFYSDAALARDIIPPLVADAKGAFVLYVSPGVYFYQAMPPRSAIPTGCFSFTATSLGGNGFVSALGKGVAAAFGSCTAGFPCGVQAGPNYNVQDTFHPNVSGGYLNATNAGNNLNYFYNPFADITNSGNEYTFSGNNCIQDFLNQPPPGSGGTTNNLQSVCTNTVITESAATPNYGYFGLNTSGQLVSKAASSIANIHSSGIYSDVSSFTSADGNMDYNEYRYKNWYANGEAPSGENFESNPMSSSEGGADNTGEVDLIGTIVSGGAGATSIRANCYRDCQHAGTERWLVDYDQPLGTGYVTGWAASGVNTGPNQMRGTSSIAVTETLPVSTCTGTVAPGWAGSDNGPNTAWDVQFENNGGPPVTWVTFNTTSCSLAVGDILGIAGRSQWVKVMPSSSVPAYSASSTYQYGQGATYAGGNYISLTTNNAGHTPSSSPTQWAAITAGSGQQTVAVQPTHSIISGNTFYANGVAGFGALFDANNAQGNVAYPSGNGAHYPIPLLGSPDAHHMVAQLPLNGATYHIGNVVFFGVALNSVSITGGVATISINGDANALANNSYVVNASSLAITGNSNAALNTQYNTSSVVSTNYPATLTATPCTTLNASPCTTNTATLTGTGGMLSVSGSGYGNSRHVIVPMSPVRNVNDPSVTPAQIANGTDKATGNYFQIDPNVGTWAPGNRVFETLLETNTGFNDFISFSANNPYRAFEGSQNYFNGQALTVLNGNGRPPSIYGWLSGVDARTLDGDGGTGTTAPWMFSVFPAPGTNGVANTFGYYYFAPYPNNSPMLHFGCPVTTLGCSDPNYSTPVFDASGAHGNGQVAWNAANQSLTDNTVYSWFHGGTYHYFTDILGSPPFNKVTIHNTVSMPDALGTTGSQIVMTSPSSSNLNTFTGVTGLTPFTGKCTSPQTPNFTNGIATGCS